MKIKRTNKHAIIPTKGTTGAAGFDLYSTEDVGIWKGRTELVNTGIAIELPEGYEGQVRSRSGCAKNGLVVANSPGTIDCDYRGDIGVLLYNNKEHSITIRKGDRIAQLVIQEVPDITFEEVEELDTTNRGAGGFGSTGK